MSLARINEEWIPLQVKVFSRWVSNQLKEDSQNDITDVTKDLSNGVALVKLATSLTQKQAPRQWVHDPKRNVDKVQNCDMAVDMFAKDGVRFVGISGKDINDNNEKLILGLVWSLITHYSIGKTVSTDDSKINDSTGNKCNNSKDYKNVLLSWANDRIDSYPNIQKFTPYGLSMCALLDSYVPDKINFYSLDPNNTKANTELATHVMKELGIPVYVYPEDILRNNAVDEKNTFNSAFFS